MDYRWKNILTCLLLVVSVIIVIPWEDKPFLGDQGFVLGLDLKGGMQMTLQLDYSEKDLTRSEKNDATQQAVDILYRRINQFGLTQPEIQKTGVDSILVQIPGVETSRIDRVRNILSTTGTLEFYIQASQVQRDKAGQPGNNQTAPAGTKWLQSRSDARNLKKFYLVEEEPRVLGKHLETAGLSTPTGQGYNVTLSLDDEGAEQFAEATREAKQQGRLIPIALDGVVQSAPKVNEVITGGNAQIEGDFEPDEARRLVTVLNSGRLNAPIEIVQENSVGPSLGQASIQRGQIAIGLAMAVVVLFMMLYYWGLGIVVSFVLGFNLLLLAALLLLLKATLTLPGLAGILLTVGIAVDASVIIFERIREETKKNQSDRKAFEVGWNKAFWAVFDANITTLIAAIVLFYFGSQAIRGFATTLLLGVITTLFTVFFSEKALIQGLMDLGVLNLSMMDLFSGTEWKFFSKAKAGLITAGLFMICSIGVFAYGASQGGRIFGLEFTGGQMMNLNMEKEVTSNQIRNKLSDITLGNNFHPYIGAEVQRTFEGASESSSEKSTSSVNGGGSKAKNGPAECSPASPCTFQLRLKGSRIQRVAGFYIPRDLNRIFGETEIDPKINPGDESVLVSFSNLDPRPLEEFRSKIHSFRYEDSYITPYSGQDITIPGQPDAGGSETTDRIKIELSNSLFQAYLRNDLIRTFRDMIAPPRESVLERSPKFTFMISLQQETPISEVRQQLVDVFNKRGIERNPFVRPVNQKGASEQDNVRARQFVVETHPDVRSTISEAYDEILSDIHSGLALSGGPFGGRVQSIDAQVAESFKRDAFWAISLSWIAILFYLAFRFQFAYGVGAVFALIHDVFLCVGLVALTDLLLPPELGVNLDIGMSSLAAFLTVVGYSVNDSIVTFDRIREIIQESRNKTLGEIIDESINLNLSRTILTSVTTFLAAAVLFFVTASSGTDVASFAFPIMIGVIIGTFSSMFIASPLLVYSPLVGKPENTRASRLKQ